VLNNERGKQPMKTQTIPNDGRWHDVPSSHVEAPAFPWIQLDIGAGGVVQACNTGPEPTEVRYDDLADDFDKADQRWASQ
jgi:hypothetical protein